jgi:hypothetical protein
MCKATKNRSPVSRWTDFIEARNSNIAKSISVVHVKLKILLPPFDIQLEQF